MYTNKFYLTREKLKKRKQETTPDIKSLLFTVEQKT